MIILFSPWRFFKLLCFSVGFVTIGISSLGGVYAYYFFYSLPDWNRFSYQDLQKRGKARIHWRLQDKTIKPKWTKIDDVHRDFLFAIVMSEDGTFFEHSGLNYDAMINSLAVNLKKRSYSFGASTISQQLVKNLFLTRQKTMTRKLKEILITRGLERRFSKNNILEVYLNVAEFGPDIFGVDAAARHYFGKTPAQINAAEGAFLALMLPSPRRRHHTIYTKQNLTAERRKHLNRVLRDMLYKEFITQREYRRYLKYDYFKYARQQSRHQKGRKRNLAGRSGRK